MVIRTIQYNMLKMRDKYLHTNCLAALANMSGQFRSLHPYVAQRLVSLFETLAKKHARLDQQLKQSVNGEAAVVDVSASMSAPSSDDMVSWSDEPWFSAYTVLQWHLWLTFLVTGFVGVGRSAEDGAGNSQLLFVTPAGLLSESGVHIAVQTQRLRGL